MTNPTTSLSAIQQRVWDGKLLLEIVLDPSECRTFDESDPYLISYPRLSYLPFLLPRLHSFFESSLIEPNSQPHTGWFSFEGVPLKWHYPVGLLCDLYSGTEPVPSKTTIGGDPSAYSMAFTRNEETKVKDEDNKDDKEEKGTSTRPHRNPPSESGNNPLPWRLTLHFQNWPDQDLVQLDADGMVMHDAFINSVKEADFLRNGNAKKIMSLSKDDSSALWKSVQDHDLTTFRRINNELLPSPSEPFRNAPIRIFLPLQPDASQQPYFKIVQSPLPPTIVGVGRGSQNSRGVSPSARSPALSATAAGAGAPVTRPQSQQQQHHHHHHHQQQQQQQTIGSALNSLLPNLFPSRRFPVLAKPMLHGVVLPMVAPIEEVVRSSAYGDGWVSIVISMVG